MRYLFSCLCFLLLSSALFGQNIELNFARLSVENGLSNNNTTCTFQDSRGFIWIGTQDGLNRYNGYEFTHFKHNPKDKKSISNNIILAIYEDRLENLWVGTQEGLNRYDRKSRSFSTYKHHKDSATSILNNKIYTIVEDKNGYLWVGTEEGISRMDRERKYFTHFKFPSYYDAENNAATKAIIEDRAGNILVGTYGAGLLIKANNKKDFVPMPAYADSLKQEFIQDIFQDSKGNYWIGTLKGIRKIDTKNQLLSFAPYQYSANDKEFNQILSIEEDKQGRIWAGTYGGGLLMMNPADPIHFQIFKNDFKKSYSISRDLINHIFVDKIGTVWVATDGGGLSVYDEGRDKFEHFSYEIGSANALTNNIVTSFYEDETGVLWVGTGGGGLNKISSNANAKKTFTSFKNNPLDRNSISDNYITCIAPSKNGGLWVGTSNGLNYLDKQTNKFRVFKRDITKKESLEDDHIISLLEDEDEVLWIGTYEGGLNRFDPQKNTFKAYQNIAEFAEYTLSDNMVQVITQDRDKFLWIGTGGGGLNRFDKKTEKFTVFKNKLEDSLSLAHNSIKSIYEDSKGTIWVGTHGGLDKFDKVSGTFQNFDRKNGLPSNTIHGILEDKKGYLWLSTNAGLAHFWIDKNIFYVYDLYDNLQSDQFNTGAAMKSKTNGKMYFGGNRGFNAFYPDSVENNTQKPPVYITDFQVIDRNTKKNRHINIDDLLAQESEKQRIVLTHEENTFTIDFVALNYRHSEKNEYQWQLEGHDKDWTKPSKQRSVTYTNLPNGKYKFKVRASNNDGVWSEVSAELLIEVQKAIWDTVWFRLLIALLLIGAIYGVYKVRVYQVERQNRRLERQVQERTLEISKQKDEIMKIYSELQVKQEQILTQQQDIVAKNEFLEKANDEVSAQRNLIEKSFADIQIISEIGQKITTISHHDFVIETVFDKITTLVDVDMFRIGILDKETKKIVFQGFSGKERISTYYHDFSTREGQHLSLWCIENQKEILINDFDKEYNNYIKNGKIDTSIKDRPQSVIYLPLIVEEECIGVMTVQSYKKNVYTYENINILKTLSTFTSIAIDNYRNYTELSEAKKEIENNKQKTEDSIRYAETIQKAILPDDHFLKSALDEYFVIFEPQAIVSGDFYWCKKVGNKVFLAVVDCTGHGVPGAFMSIIGSTILNDIVIQQKNHEPAHVLEELHFGIRTALRQENRINDDGMDICFCVLERQATEDDTQNYSASLTFAGAKRPLYYVIDGKLETLNANKRSIGGGRNVLQSPFTQQTITLPKGAMIYLATDGYADQNSPEKEKIGSQNLKQWLQEVSHEPVAIQDIKMLTRLVNHMADKTLQRDDITLIGVRI